jgi:uncharacterized protein
VCPDADDEERIASFCKGYVRGASLHPSWMNDDRGLGLLFVFTALAGETPESELPVLDDQAASDREAWLQEHRNKLGGYVAEAFDLFATDRVPVIAKPKVGRNDACPCGSGKKHKKCCLS